MEEDRDLKLITARKMAQLRRRVEQSAAAKVERSNKDIVLGMLYDRGDEVLQAAMESYPAETARVIDQIAKMIQEKKVVEKISGGDLLSALRSLGMRISLRTTIRVEDHGRLVNLADKLRKNDE